MRKLVLSILVTTLWLYATGLGLQAQPDAKKEETKQEAKKSAEDLKKEADEAKAKKEREDAVAAATKPEIKADSAWMMVSTAFVMLMVPGLALFYGGMVRRKNILATMMHSMIALAVVGVLWIGIGYSLAFGAPWIKTSSAEGSPSIIGYSSDLVFMRGIKPDQLLPNTNIPVFLHMLYQGMFCIITPALISGAIAERIRFRTYLVFLVLWVLVVYCPLAHMVWALDWWSGAANAGQNAVGYFGMPNPNNNNLFALDFAGGTVVHISAGFASLAAILVLRKRLGYPQQAFHPSSMVLTLTGAGLLWFGWFGFNGGSGLMSGPLAVSAFAATQAAAAGAGLSWVLVEWLHRGKPTALGLASGIVAGLVAVTPASGYVLPYAGLIIGLIAGVVCYCSVFLKSVLKYDDSLDAFGVHGVGGFLGAVLTGFFCNEWLMYDTNVAIGAASGTPQVLVQLKAAAISAGLSFVVSIVMVKVLDIVMGFTVSDQEEIEGLDRTEHGESGFDLGFGLESVSATSSEPRAAMLPPNGLKHFQVVVEGIPNEEVSKIWSDLCQPKEKVAPEFKAVYPNMTTMTGNRFKFRGGDQERIRDSLQKLLEANSRKPVKAKLET